MDWETDNFFEDFNSDLKEIPEEVILNLVASIESDALVRRIMDLVGLYISGRVNLTVTVQILLAMKGGLKDSPHPFAILLDALWFWGTQVKKIFFILPCTLAFRTKM